MKRMTCEICGGHRLIKAYGSFLCETCGTKYSLEEAKSLWNDNAESENDMALTFVDKQLERMHERKMEKMRLESAERIASILDDDDNEPVEVPPPSQKAHALNLIFDILCIFSAVVIIFVILALI